jgi:hypothetical protein
MNIKDNIPPAFYIPDNDPSESITSLPVPVAQGGTGSTTGNVIGLDMSTPPAMGGTTANTIRSKIDEDVIAATGNISSNQCSGGLINNYGQTNDTTLTLPACVEGMNLIVFLSTTVAKFFLLHPNASDYIYLDGVLGAIHKGVQVASAAAGNCIQLIAVKNGASKYDWAATTVSGPWIVEA